MNFTSQICTTEEQSERLLALGLKRETADMHYHCIVCSEYPEYILMLNSPKIPLDIPAWSLHRLIEMANTYIEISPFTGVYFRDGAFSTDRVNDYDAIIDIIEWLIKEGDFNKEYL